MHASRTYYFLYFEQKCNANKYCRRLSIPECITLVTQRLTKYPMLIEAIVKTTKGMLLPLHLNIIMYNLHSVPYSGLKVLEKRICLTINSFFGYRSFFKFS